MASERSPERDKAKQIWLESGGAMKLKDIDSFYF
ncbi:phage terminase small subunit-related protein [Paenibacillus jamilae]